MQLDEHLRTLGKLPLQCEDASILRCQDFVKQGLLSLDDLNHALALHFGLEVLTMLPKDLLPKESYKVIPYLLVKQQLMIPIGVKDDFILVLLFDPLNAEGLQELRSLLRKPLKALWGRKELVLEAIERSYALEEGSAGQLIAHLSKESKALESSVDLEDLLDDRENAPAIQLLNVIITEAIQQGASDIHFEPFEHEMMVRYRIDGVLQRRHFPPKEYQAALITRLKVMAKLDIAEHRLPQDGRIKLRLAGREIDMRLSTVPVPHGERIVLRLLDKGNISLGLDFLKMPPGIQTSLQNLIHAPEGIILVTGPTGSGKTTTLYSCISALQSDEINIMTIEDPIEYKLPGIAQIGVQPKINLDFATGLRHILRQDPDVVLIGEIRDLETAQIAIQASLTGHLVFSTLHTNDAPSAIVRLVDMGIEPYLLASSIIGVLAQRLVRLLCPSCKQPYSPTAQEELSFGHSLFQPLGCPACAGTGFKGRQGLFELLILTPTLKELIHQKEGSHVIRNQALKLGMPTLEQNGLQLIREGLTTVAEILRCCHFDPM